MLTVTTTCSVWRACLGAAALWLGLGVGVQAGQIEPETNLRRDLGPLSPQEVILGNFWNHTPEYYQARIEAGAERLTGVKITHDQMGLFDQLAVAYLQLERYDEALAAINRKAELDPEDYGLHANRSIIYARRAYGGHSPDTAADWAAAEVEARAALVKAADPLKRDGLYLRLIVWLQQAAADPGLRGRQSFLGYDILARLDAAIARDSQVGIAHPRPIPPADLMKLLEEDSNLLEILPALVAIDSLAVPDGLLALSDLCAAQGDIETAYDGYCRLGELGAGYPGDFLELRRQRLLQTVQAEIAVGPDHRLQVPLDATARRSLDEQCYQRYLAARRAAQAYTRAYDSYERETLKLPNLPGQRKLLESFHKQMVGAPPLAGADAPSGWEPATKSTVDDFDSAAFLVQIAIWVPGALVCVTLLFAAVRLFRRYDRMSAVGS